MIDNIEKALKVLDEIKAEMNMSPGVWQCEYRDNFIQAKVIIERELKDAYDQYTQGYNHGYIDSNSGGEE